MSSVARVEINFLNSGENKQESDGDHPEEETDVCVKNSETDGSSDGDKISSIKGPAVKKSRLPDTHLVVTPGRVSPCVLPGPDVIKAEPSEEASHNLDKCLQDYISEQNKDTSQDGLTMRHIKSKLPRARLEHTPGRDSPAVTKSGSDLIKPEPKENSVHDLDSCLQVHFGDVSGDGANILDQKVNRKMEENEAAGLKGEKTYTEIQNGIFPCVECCLVFPRLANLQKHKKMMHSDNCDQPGQCDDVPHDLSEHKRNVIQRAARSVGGMCIENTKELRLNSDDASEGYQLIDLGVQHWHAQQGRLRDTVRRCDNHEDSHFGDLECFRGWSTGDIQCAVTTS